MRAAHFRFAGVIFFVCAFMRFFPSAPLQGAPNQPEPLVRVRIKEWNDTFAREEMKKGTPVEKLDKLLERICRDRANQHLGGTGQYIRRYLIDDYIEISTLVSREHELESAPQAHLKLKWLKRADGTVVYAGYGEEADDAVIGKPHITTQPAALVGRWTVVRVGDKVPPLSLIWTIDDKAITVTDQKGNRISQNAYTIDKSKNPPEFVMKVDGEKDRVGRFRFVDDHLQIVMTIGTGEAPKSWEDGSSVLFEPVQKE